MNEKVSISDINIPNNFKDIKTNYKITLYDKDTGEEVYSTDGHNKLNPNLGLRPWCMTYGAALTSNTNVNVSSSYSSEMPTGIYFYNSPDDPSTNHPGGPHRGTRVGAGELNVSSSAAKRCSYNPNESKYEIIYEDGIAYKHCHIVMDATTAQLNGEINTVVIGAGKYVSSSVFGAEFQVRTTNDFTSTVQAHQQPSYGKNASLMSFHPDRPSWLTAQAHDSNVYGTWSFESDNTAWFSPYPRDGISGMDDIMFFHYDLKTWKVLGTIKLSLPSECIGKQLIAYKFDDCIGVYPRITTGYSEKSDGSISYSTNPSYIFNLNGDYVKSVGRSLNLFDVNRAMVVNNKLYYWPVMKNYDYYGFIVFDSEYNVLGGFRAKDYMQDSRFGTSSGYGKYAYNLRPVFILDKITGDYRAVFMGSGTSSTNYYGHTYLSWNMNKGQVEWLATDDIYIINYPFSYFGSQNRLVVVLDGIPFMLPTDGSSYTFWPFIWHHWCKLPSPVVKTANTTMKIQIDLYYPIVGPFTFLAPPDGQASSTES